MNSEQLRLFINGAFGSEADARKVKALLEPYLRLHLEEIRRMVEQLSDESLARQREWRVILDEIERRLEPYSETFAVELSRQLPVSGAAAAEETTLMLKSVVPRTAGLVPPAAIMADSTKFLLNTKISDRRLLGLFAPSTTGGVSPFTKANRRLIDSIVTGGIINGVSTEQISKAIEDELPGRMRNQAMALARTAIQDYNRQVKEEVWNANRDAFARLGLKYEWVSALDSRTCPTCAPLDGEVRDGKGDFPETPAHINCRCQVVLVDPEDPGKVRYGQQAMVEKPTGDGAYKTKKVVKGEKLYRKNKEVKTVNGKSPRYADFLADSNLKTQQMFFGGGKLGIDRAEKFRRLIKNGRSPQDALVKMTNVVEKGKPTRRFVPADAQLTGLSGKRKPAPKPKAAPAPKPEPKPKPISLSPEEKALKKAAEFQAREKARQAAKRARQEATQKLEESMDSGELAKALAAADKKVVAKPETVKLFDARGVDPLERFEESNNILGNGMFGAAKRVRGGVAKKGTITKNEVESLRLMESSPYTPKLLGEVYTEPKFTKHYTGTQARKGAILMEQGKGQVIYRAAREMDKTQQRDAFDKVLKARKELHQKGIAHQDMHEANVLYDLKSKELTVIDFGMARLDPRAALIEGLGTRRGKIDYGIVREPGDYQSTGLFRRLNKGNAQSSNPTWKRFEANRRRVEAILKEEAPEAMFASIRTIPRAVSKKLTKDRALELIEILYEGI